MKALYYVVFLNEKPVSIIKSANSNTRLIAGRDIGTSFFRNGIPNSLVDVNVCFLAITTKAWHPAIEFWLKKIPKPDIKRSVFLSECDKSECVKFRKRGMKIPEIAERFNVSESTIKRVVNR